MTHPSPTALEEKNAIAATDRDAAHVRTDHAVPSVVLAAVKACAASWVPDARLLGNVRAGDIVRAIAALEAELAKAHESASEWEKSNLACSLRIKSLEAQLATRLPTAPQNEIAELCRNLIQHNGLSADYAKHALDVINPQLVELARAHEDLVARHAKLTGKYQAALAVALDKSQTIPDHEHLTWDNCPHEHIGCQDCGAPVSGAATPAPTAALTEEPDPYADGAHPCNAGSTVRPRAKSPPQGAEE